MHRIWICPLAIAVCLAPTFLLAADVTTEDLLDDMISFDRLVRMPEPAYRTYQFSSYDRLSDLPEGQHWFGNSDGFGNSRIPAIIRKVKEADRNGVGTFVIAEMHGPGAIVRCWTAAANRARQGINGNIRLYLDDAEEPIFQGKAYEFLYDLYGAMARQHGMSDEGLSEGFGQRDACYCPIGFAKSCRIEWIGDLRKIHFYHIELRQYAEGTVVETFAPKMLDTLRAKFNKVGEVLARPTGHLKPTGEMTTLDATVPPGRAHELLKLEGRSGKITWFELKLDAKNLDRALRQTVLKITFDDHSRPQIESPLGDFFGAAPGINPYDSLPMEVRSDGTMICRFAMPFARSVRCDIDNRGNEQISVAGKAFLAPHHWDKSRDMHFYARWRVNHNMQVVSRPLPRECFDIPFLCARGEGRFVGVSVHLMNPGTTPSCSWWGEGDEKIFVDDDTNTPSFFGTGAEDYFNYSWGHWYLFEHAYFAQPRCDGPATRGFIVNNRWHILDDVPFHQRFDFFMEMNHHTAIDEFDYARITYYYGRPGITSDHMPPFREDLREPRRPDNWLPTSEYRQHNAIYYQAENLDGASELLDSDPQWSAGKRVLFKPSGDGDTLSLDFNVAETGKYRVHIVMSMTPNAGKCDVLLNGEPLPGLSTGKGAIDLFTPFHTIARWFGSPPVELRTGKNTITFVSRNKNPASQGTDLGADFLWIQP